MKRAVRRSTTLLILFLSFAAGAQAAPLRGAAPEPASLLAAAWSWIVLHALPAPKPVLTPRTEKAGCEIDPDGHVRCVPDAVTQTEAGCEMDPDGVR